MWASKFHECEVMMVLGSHFSEVICRTRDKIFLETYRLLHLREGIGILNVKSFCFLYRQVLKSLRLI